MGEREREPSARHERLIAGLEALLYRHDPIGIAFGDNPDEYSPEAGTIAPRVSDAGSVEDIVFVVHEEFVRWFDEDTAGPASRYRAIAEEIRMLLQAP